MDTNYAPINVKPGKGGQGEGHLINLSFPGGGQFDRCQVRGRGNLISVSKQESGASIHFVVHLC